MSVHPGLPLDHVLYPEFLSSLPIPRRAAGTVSLARQGVPEVEILTILGEARFGMGQG